MDLEKILRMGYWGVGIVGWIAVIEACIAVMKAQS